MTQHSSRVRRWRVNLADGTAVELTAVKLLETGRGALMLVGADQQPTHVIAAGQWIACEELRSAGGGR